VACPQSEADN
jgi:Flp pilus assembly protein TadG